MARKQSNRALLLVDLQNDFCDGGSLAVAGGDDIIPLANSLQSFFDMVIATQDWHPDDHTSFAANHPGQSVGDKAEVMGLMQELWPVHCVQNSSGAEFHPELALHRIVLIVKKGIDRTIDSYSAFYDNARRRATGLETYLREHDINDIYILGLATDYCVKFSAIDAAQHGFNVYVIIDACRGVELQPGDTARAIAEMAAAGVHIIQSSDILSANQ